MKVHQIVCFTLVMLLATSCKSETLRQKEQQINASITAMKTKMDALQDMKDGIEANQNPKKDDTADKIIGVWEVKNDYYMAIYEIEKMEGKYIGKIHYYNDGKTEYTGKNAEEDYFLDGITYESGTYKNGKMYMPDGTNYQVIFTLKNNDELEVKMTVQGSSYTEIWKRQIQNN